MKNKIRMLLTVIIFVGLGAAGFMFANHKSPKISTSKEQLEPKPIFQPEVVTSPQDQLNGTTTNKTAQDQLPTSTTTPFVYEPNICLNVSDKQGCLREHYEGVVKAYGSDVAFTDLKKRASEDSYVSSQCHPLAHIIGWEASNAYKTVSEAYLHGDSFCWSGYYHGVMEGIVARVGPEKLPKTLDTICADLPGKATYNFDYYNCVHGLGHGIMEMYHDEVFDSLHMCDNLSGNWEQLSCQSGVFMENIIAENKNGYSKFLKPEEPLYPCSAVEYKYKDQCYLGQTSYALQVTSYNFSKVFDLCATVEDPFRTTCSQSIGRDAANQARHEKNLTKTTCALSKNSQDVTNCVIGAVKEIISYYHDISQAKDYCDLYEGSDKQTCSSIAEAYYKSF